MPSAQHDPQTLAEIFACWEGSVQLWQSNVISAAELITRLLMLERAQALRDHSPWPILGATKSLSAQGFWQMMGMDMRLAKDIESAIKNLYAPLPKPARDASSILSKTPPAQHCPMTQLGLIMAATPSNAFVSLLAQRGLLGLSEKASDTLLYWQTQIWHFRVVHRELTPRELLELQCSGKRVISLFCEKDLFVNFQHGIHDSIGFILHDLVHGEKYFRSREQQMEISSFYHEFFDFIESIIPDSLRERWHYLIADMNTHWKHSVQTFQSLLFDWHQLVAPTENFQQWLVQGMKPSQR